MNIYVRFADEAEELAFLRKTINKAAYQTVDAVIKEFRAESSHIKKEVCLEAFIDSGGDVNAYSKDGWTLLTTACDISVFHLVLDLVLTLRADVNKPTTKGYTPIMLSKTHSFIKLLLDNGADNPYAKANVDNIVTANFSLDNIIALAIMLTGEQVVGKGQFNDTSRIYLKAFCCIYYLLDKCKKENKPFSLLYLYNLFDISDLIFVPDYYHPEEGDTEDLIKSVLNKYDTNIPITKEYLDLLKDVSFENNFSVDWDMTHSKEGDTFIPLEKDWVLCFDKNLIEVNIDDVLCRQQWCPDD